MILKTKTPKGWSISSDISNAEIYYDKEIGQTCVSLQFWKSSGITEIPISNETYLCNDEGKTIERIHYVGEIDKPAK